VIDQLIITAKQQLGKPYVWDGKGPNSFDCSGLMQYIFKKVTGKNIGSWTVPQESSGVKVKLNQLQKGDLLFWGASGSSYHVALYLGNNTYIHALRPGTYIKIDQISNNFAPSFGVRIFPN
ncbi:MAG: C40 family peptidase, partial [Lactobacillaceae bacterium]